MAANRTTEYAVRALVVLAMEGSQGKVRQAAELAKLSGTPPKFLEQVLRILSKGGLVRSRRGAGGGYELARPVGRIRMDEVVALMAGAEEQGSLGRGDPVGEEWGKSLEKARRASRDSFREDTLEKFVDRLRNRLVGSHKGSEYQI